ncbi:VPDSG-CTERM sorting domain-containing protein [Pelagicoccus enzymogenes]|uniref:VPDSG-CTERM sorting domain-containing protein n=1 Tax=Pelagicoccus enzymogenes TaxID=2773457 RepID=UPI00280DED0D|nr:VPDSG-CTERM sorting domain-containing protein [Pelagicoccus enzymogenes]MDQ8197024.1 VPDSG-CTERM sorting domain-containing protein [Pelagicoccus enzymogenes]
MNLVRSTLAALLVAAAAATASATMTFTQFKSGSPLDFLSSGGDTQYSSTFNNIKNGGTLLSTFLTANPNYEIVSAIVEFGFADDGGDSYEYAKAYISGKFVKLFGDHHNSNDAVEVDGSHDYGYSYRDGEIAEEDFGDLEDGIVEFKVKADQGDFYLKTAKITVEVDKKSVEVPDSGSTLLLLGAALGVIGFIRRRR